MSPKPNTANLAKIEEIAALLAPEDATNSTRRPTLVEVDELPRESSWTPIPIPMSGLDEPDETPTLLPVRGALPLLYEGKVNTLYGETESGKSLVALHAADELLRSDPTCRVLWLDYEDTVRSFAKRCRSFGMGPEITNRIDYLNPTEPVSNVKSPRSSSEYAHHLIDLVAGRSYRLAVIDTMNEALAVEGADPNDADDFATVNRWLMRKIIDLTGAGVLSLDHVTKSREGRGKYAYGTGAKLTSISGAAYVIEVVNAWSRALQDHPVEGQALIKITKDRPGGRRNGLPTMSTLAVVEVIAHPDGLLGVHLVQPADTVFRPHPDHIRRALDFVRDNGPTSPTKIANKIGGNYEQNRQTVKWLQAPERRVLVDMGSKGRGRLVGIDEAQVREHGLT